ncbi:methyltransferase family protein [Litorisediminicola beolgyonensis]|uniref:Methyltransferase family protein n=1 Tax=Litorisediminicola beolgyonensis TaxID=1173614 RepID=A0ABW3ZKA7_9RHOB
MHIPAQIPPEAAAAPRRVDQSRRIRVLRIAFVALLPLMLFTRSAWSEMHWFFDLFEVSGIFLVIAGVLGRFWAILYIGGRKNRTVVDEGPYSICRHPLYLFSTLGVLGFGMMLGSLVLTVLFGGLVLVILQITAGREEAFLRASLGDDYAAYAARVPRILPKLSGFRTGPTVEVDLRHLRGNLFDALVFLSFIPIAELLEVVKEEGWVTTFAIW